MRRTLAAASIGLLLAGALVASTAVRAQIYHWVDEEGRTHFTDNLHEVPGRYRRDAKDIQEDLRKELIAEETSAQAAQAAAQAPPAVRPEPEPGDGPDAQDLAALEQMLAEGGATKLLAAAGAGVLASFGIAMLVGLFVIAALSSLMLILACRIVRTEPPGFVKGMGIASAQLVANLAVSVLAVLLLGVSSAGAAQFQAASFGWSFLIYAGVLHGLHGTGFGTSLLVSLVAMLLTVAVGLGLGLLAVCAGGLAAFSG